MLVHRTIPNLRLPENNTERWSLWFSEVGSREFEVTGDGNMDETTLPIGPALAGNDEQKKAEILANANEAMKPLNVTRKDVEELQAKYRMDVELIKTKTTGVEYYRYDDGGCTCAMPGKFKNSDLGRTDICNHPTKNEIEMRSHMALSHGKKKLGRPKKVPKKLGRPKTVVRKNVTGKRNLTGTLVTNEMNVLRALIKLGKTNLYVKDIMVETKFRSGIYAMFDRLKKKGLMTITRTPILRCSITPKGEKAYREYDVKEGLSALSRNKLKKDFNEKLEYQAQRESPNVSTNPERNCLDFGKDFQSKAGECKACVLAEKCKTKMETDKESEKQRKEDDFLTGAVAGISMEPVLSAITSRIVTPPKPSKDNNDVDIVFEDEDDSKSFQEGERESENKIKQVIKNKIAEKFIDEKYSDAMTLKELFKEIDGGSQ